MAAIDNFTAVPNTFIDGGDHVVVLGRYGGTMKDGGAALMEELVVDKRLGFFVKEPKTWVSHAPPSVAKCSTHVDPDPRTNL